MFLPAGMFILGWLFGIYYHKYSTFIKVNFERKIALVEPTFKRAAEQGNISVAEVLLSGKKPLFAPLNTTVPIELNTTEVALLHPLDQFLLQHRFRDAFRIYLDEEDPDIREGYAQKLEHFLSNELKTKFEKAEKFVQTYLKEVPTSTIRFQLIEHYLQRQMYHEAITQQLRVDEFFTSESNLTASKKRLQVMSSKYIKELKVSRLYNILISFLEDMVNRRPLDTFFKYELAELYALLNKKEEVTPMLEELLEDEFYGSKAKLLIENLASSGGKGIIDYKYTIPLTKQGEHYIVPTYIEGKLYHLMVDTGASSVFVSSNKLGELKLLQENYPVNTAGGKITAKLYNAKSLTMGPVTLENIEVVAAPYDHKKADGLLGMNFFKQFIFFLDQDKSLLYLNPKE
jgi:clan AA aspartic protease (TIGR02281 family)